MVVAIRKKLNLIFFYKHIPMSAIIGISAFFHDSACCLLQNGALKAAAQEERFTRVKHDASMPYHAIRYCLEEAKLSLADIDCIAFYENPEKKLSRQLWNGVEKVSRELLNNLSPLRFESAVRDMLGYSGEIKYFDHHHSHAASSFFFSGFDEAAILTVDGVGEWATTTYGTGNRNKIELLEEVQFPNSIGLLYSTITNYIGFEVNGGEYKVMGLAPYGRARYVDEIRRLITLKEGGQFELNMEFFDFHSTESMFTDKLSHLLGEPQRKPESGISQFHKDVAHSLQVVLEEVLLEKVNYLYEKTSLKYICMAGGVALNCVANGRILRKGPFDKMFVQPAANDSGGALGAAAAAHIEMTNAKLQDMPLKSVFLGPEYNNRDIRCLLDAAGLNFNDHHGNLEDLFYQVASMIAEGKVVGWFQGRMEFGPRALGNRSILADPRGTDMRDRINSMVKKREAFRPFAPAVLEAYAKDHFDLDHSSPFMLETCPVISHLDLPAITHVDNSARVQTVNFDSNPRFAMLLEAFNRITSCPILLNTSFNVRGEPIVCSPEDALKCFIMTDIDCLVMNDYVIERDKNSMEVKAYIMSIMGENLVSGIQHNTYTFV
jgi:carbamoyltransferase